MLLEISAFTKFLLATSLVGFGAQAEPLQRISMHVSTSSDIQKTYVVASDISVTTSKSVIPEVPFFSQFSDIHKDGWQKIGCGVTSLAMMINYYHPGIVSVDTLLEEGIAAGAYLPNAGWKHYDLILLSTAYGLHGQSYDFGRSSQADALALLLESLQEGPVIASVHYKFNPKSTIPHLVVLTGISGDRVYYNDPAGKVGGQSLALEEFLPSWKKRFIEIRDGE